MPLRNNAEIERTHERVVAADAVVEKDEGFAGGVAFQPEGDAAEVHSQRVSVHAIGAMADDIPNGFPDGFRRGFVLAGAESGEQHMIRAASDVNGLEREQPWTVAAGVCRNC